MVILVECSAQGGFSLWSKKIQPSQKVLILKLSPYVGQTSSLGSETAPNNALASCMLVASCILVRARVQVLLLASNC